MAKSEGSNRWITIEKGLGLLTALLALATGFFGYQTATITQARDQAQAVVAEKNSNLSSLQSRYDTLKGQHDVVQAESARLRGQLGHGEAVDNSPATAGVSLNDLTPLSTDGVSYQFGPQTVNAKPYSRSLFTDSCRDVTTYQLDYKYKKFHVAAGLGDNSSTDGSATFAVQVDKKAPEAVTLGVGQAPQRFEMDLTGAFRISLSVESNGCAGRDATAVWIDPILEL